MLRTKSVGTKVTEDEYGTLQRLAAGQTLSEWVRDVLLATATPRPADHVLLAELLALRTIVVNLQFALAAGETPTVEAVRRLIDRADADKFQRAIDRHVAMLQGRER